MSKQTYNQFGKLIDQAIEEADKLLTMRDKEYNRGTIEIPDYFNSIGDPEKAAFSLVWIKVLRLKSHILEKQSGEEHKRIEDILDAINYLRFLYGLIKKQEEGK